MGWKGNLFFFFLLHENCTSVTQTTFFYFHFAIYVFSIRKGEKMFNISWLINHYLIMKGKRLWIRLKWIELKARDDQVLYMLLFLVSKQSCFFVFTPNRILPLFTFSFMQARNTLLKRVIHKLNFIDYQLNIALYWRKRERERERTRKAQCMRVKYIYIFIMNSISKKCNRLTSVHGSMAFTID